MTTPQRHVSQRPRWRSTFVGGLLSALLLMAPGAWTAQPAPASPAAPPSAATARKAYVGLFKDHAVAVLDTSSNRVLKTIPVPLGPHGIAMTPDGRKVYVSSDGASTVSVIDTTTDRVVDHIEVGPTPHGLAISPDGRQVLVAGFGTNQAILIDTVSDRVVGRVPVPQPHNSAISADGHTAYVASQQQGAMALVMLDLAQKTQVGQVPLDQTPRALDLSPDGTRLYFTLAGVDAVQVLETVSHRVIGQIPVGASPHYPRLTPDGHVGLVVSQGPGELAILDPAHNTVSSTVVVGNLPHWIATSADGRTAYVTNEGSNNVSVVDLTSHRVTATIPIGHAPRKIVVQPGPAGPALSSALAPAGAPTGPAATAEPEARSITLGTLTFSDHGTKDVKGQGELDLEADDYYFAPTFLRGAPGQKLTLEIENASGTLHNFSIPEQHLDQDIPPKGKVKVEVTIPPSGAVRFFCKFHAALGMNGELLAGDAAPQSVSHGVTHRTGGEARH
jgi:YVTN family beta-propeller protein